MRGLALVGLLCSTVAAAEPKPVVTLEQHYMPGGGRRTLFVAYDDGLTIYNTRRRSTEMGSGYASVLLDDAERAFLIAHVPPDEAWSKLPPNSDAAPGTFDGVWQQICLFRGGQKRCVGVRGELEEGPGNNRRAVAPAYLELYDKLAHYKHPRGKPWAPERVTVRLYLEKRGRSIPWPAKWNAPVEEQTTKPPELPHSTTSVPGGDLRALQLIADDHKLVIIAGRKYDVQYDVSLPAQLTWQAR